MGLDPRGLRLDITCVPLASISTSSMVHVPARNRSVVPRNRFCTSVS
jgi:hypothetical protein